jgi:hypothetical protein
MDVEVGEETHGRNYSINGRSYKQNLRQKSSGLLVSLSVLLGTQWV